VVAFDTRISNQDDATTFHLSSLLVLRIEPLELSLSS
jgi:hypothetical protein